MKFLTTLLSVFLLFPTLWAQNPALKSKWGEIPAADMAMTVYEKDSSATSVALLDIGNMSIEFLTDKITAYLDVHRRIKIFDPSAFEKGNLTIPYYSYHGNEKVTYLDVQVIQPNGEVQKVKSDNVFSEKISKHYAQKKVFIPNLQKGSIIEYKYGIKSENIVYLRAWDFQEEIPVRYSEFTIVYPNTLLYHNIDNNLFGRIKSTATEEVFGRYTKKKRVYFVEYAPALKEEPYITTLDDYGDRVDFYLSHYYDGYGAPHPVIAVSWEELAKNLIDKDEYKFGSAFSPKSRSNKDLWEAFLAENNLENDSVLGIAEKALRFVSKKIRWNGEYSAVPRVTPDEALEKRSGTTGDINLALLALLKRAKIDAYPVMTSSVDNGRVQTEHPVITGFNSLFVVLKHNDKMHLMDATNPYIKLGNLTRKHYNGLGWLVDEKKSDWLEFGTHELSDVWLVELQLDEEGNARGKFSIMADGNEAMNWRRELDESAPKDFLKSSFFKGFTDITFDSIQVIGETEYEKPLKINFIANIKGAAEVVNDFMYFSPVFHRAYDENPFKSTKRNLPVDLVYPIRQDYIINVKLPPGYTADDLPKGERTQIPNNGGRAGVNCSQPVPGQVQVIVKNKLNQTSFQPEFYPGLKQFFDAMTKNSDIQLVFKKA